MKYSGMVQYFVWIIFILVLYFLSGCYYPKVHLERSDRKLIAYDRQNRPVIFCSESGVCDTMYFHRMSTRNGYIPNFDQWWNIHVSHTVQKGSSRGFFYSVYGTSNFPANNYTDRNLNLSFVKLSLVKTEDDDQLTLSMPEFTEKYVLNEQTKKDTLIFANLTSEGTCPSGKCLRRAYWTAEKGLIRLEKYDGSVWFRKY